MIAIASDHGGYMLKEHIKAYLAAKGITCEDFGTNSTDSCDYPDFAKPAAEAVANGQCEKGIVGPMLAERIVDTFLSTEFEGGRHARRVAKLMEIEQ